MGKKLQEEIHEGDMVNRRIHRFARKAFGDAYREAIDSEDSVLAVEDGILWKIFSDGRREKIKKVEPRLQVDTERTYILEQSA